MDGTICQSPENSGDVNKPESGDMNKPEDKTIQMYPEAVSDVQERPLINQ